MKIACLKTYLIKTEGNHNVNMFSSSDRKSLIFACSLFTSLSSTSVFLKFSELESVLLFFVSLAIPQYSIHRKC